jgi:predicted short-subunit dehydrogenase-like oxidoreductase (DUF2520 family)
VGRALARGLARDSAAGAVDLLGFLGRRGAAAEEAVQFAGTGRTLQIGDLASAHAVMFAVGDQDLEAAIASCIAAPPRSCSLWFHTSGRHGLAPLAAVAAAGARIGAFHPALPFADPADALRRLPNAPAVLQGDAHALPMLRRLAQLLHMRAMVLHGGDPLLYHAACALAANGGTALFALVEQVLARQGGLAPADRRQLTLALMQAAVAACGEQGPAAALSGPVLRGDAATVRGHLQALGQDAADALPAYRALMREALGLAHRRALDPNAYAALQHLLGDPPA